VSNVAQAFFRQREKSPLPKRVAWGAAWFLGLKWRGGPSRLVAKHVVALPVGVLHLPTYVVAVVTEKPAPFAGAGYGFCRVGCSA
jgi:hypothetical protein